VLRQSPTVLALGAAIVLAFVLLGQWAPEQNWASFEPFSVVPARLNPANVAFAGYAQALSPLFGHVFFHYGVPHLLMNGLAYVQAAPFVEQRIGGLRFLILFFVSALGGALAYVLINPNSETGAVGASGAICGVFAAYFLAVRPTPQAAIADPRIRNAMGSFLLVNVVLMALLPLPIAWQAHLGGFLAGGAIYPLLSPRRDRVGPWG